MVVRTEDYVASKLIVEERVNEFNKSNPEFEAKWRYEESEFYSDFIISMRCRDDTSINCNFRCSVEQIIHAHDPRDYIDYALKDLKAKIMKHVEKE